VRSWLAIGLLVALLIATATYARLPGSRERGTFDTDPPTPYFHYKPAVESRGQVLVVHGLDASKNVMNVLSYSLAEAGFEVFAIDLPGHGDSRAGFDALLARKAVDSVLEKLGPQTAVVGHSLGGAMLLDVANERPIQRMVLFSPAPTPLEALQAEQVLVLEGEFDPSRIRAFAPKILDSTTGNSESRDLAWTGHSGGLFRAPVLISVATWLGGDATAIHAGFRVALILAKLALSLALGIVLLGFRKAVPATEEPPEPARLSMLHYVFASLGAAAILAFVNVAAWLRIFTMDYLMGFIFLVGCILCTRCRGLKVHSRHLLIGAAAAAYLIAVAGGLGISELLHVSLTGGRWWRFPAILALSLPLFLADELLLRLLRPAWKATAIAILTRLVIGAVAVSGVLIMNRNAAFLLLLAHLIVLFWIVLWLMTGLVRKRTDPLTAALFAAIVQGWGFAALFITT
jgi:pimeloyl-ACP methyl ester carboxylesterase